MFMYDPIGKTLAQVGKDLGSDGNMCGYAIFVLRNECDHIGVLLNEDLTVNSILEKHPEYKDYRVKYENDFFGTVVLRITKEDIQ